MKRGDVEEAFARAEEFAAKQYPNGDPMRGAAAYAFVKGYLGISIEKKVSTR